MSSEPGAFDSGALRTMRWSDEESTERSEEREVETEEAWRRRKRALAMKGGGLESHLLLHVHITIISMSISTTLCVGTAECVSVCIVQEVVRGCEEDSNNKRSEMSCLVL